MDSGLKDRVAIVAGSSQGMGRATAEALAAEGTHLALCARNEKNLTAAADAIRGQYHVEVFPVMVDVTDTDALSRFVTAVADRFGRIDICIANAGGPPAKNFLSATPQEWQRAVELNLLSAVHLARLVIPHMQRRRWGRFITLTSVAVRQPLAELVLSNSVRAGVVGLVKSLANEFGKDGITVNNVAPGFTATERLKELAGTRALAAGISEDEVYRRWAAEVPLGRLAEPREVADAIVWLASERASYVTGQTIVVDGGFCRGL